MKYEINEHLFAKKLSQLLIKKGLVDKKGEPNKIALYNLLQPNNPITEAECKQDRQHVTDKTRNISNWLQGKNYPKRISDVLDLCNALDCDLDYFFTDMPAPTHNLEFIADNTNLSSDAIIYLQNATEYEQLILDTILRKKYFWDICYAIYSYMQTFYKEINIKDNHTINIVLKESEKMEFAEYRATKHFSNVLINKLANDEDIKKYNKYEHNMETLRITLTNPILAQNMENASNMYDEFREAGKGGFNDFIKHLEKEEKKSNE